jgi:hypothetical protein
MVTYNVVVRWMKDGPLPEMGEGEIHSSSFVPRQGDLLHFKEEFWEVARVISWEDDFLPDQITVIVVRFKRDSDILK